MTSTNAEGRYEFADLPAGRYTITASRSGYLRLSYGQRRPFELGKVLHIPDQALLENIDFTLPRASVIAGRVMDEIGDPIAGVRVFPLRSVYFEGRRRLVTATTPVSTDDTGQYRLIGLTPGTYFVMANIGETWTINEGGIEQVFGYTQTYYPGVSEVADAQRLTVRTGQELANIDFALFPGRAATLAGVAFDSFGRPLLGRQLSLVQEYRGPGVGLLTTVKNVTVGDNGVFRISHVAPGEYKLNVRITREEAAGTVTEAAAMPIVVNGVDIENISLATSPGWSVTGIIESEAGVGTSIRNEHIRVVGRSLSGDSGLPGIGGRDSGRVRDDWSFVVTGLHGPSRLGAQLPDGWMLRAVFQDGTDITDAPLELKGGETLRDVRIVITNRITRLSGQIANSNGAPIADGTVVVFSSDSTKWGDDSRFVRATRPGEDGNYQIQGLPSGEYFVVAIDYVQEGDWNDPEYLASIRRFAKRVVLTDAESQSVNLVLTSP